MKYLRLLYYLYFMVLLLFTGILFARYGLSKADSLDNG